MSISGTSEANNADHLSNSTPTAIDPDDAGAAGSATQASRADHGHAAVCGAPVSIVLTGTNAEGSGTGLARDTHQHAYNPPCVRLTNSGTQATVSGTEKILSWDTETFDTDTMHAGASPTRITFTTAGVYQVSWSFSVASDTDYLWIYSYLKLNGTTLIGLGSSVGTQTDNGLSPHSTGSVLYKFAAADYVEVAMAQKNTSGTADAVSTNSYFSAVWVGVG